MTEHIRDLTEEVEVPTNVNIGLTVADQNFMISLLGSPREVITQDDLPITNKTLAALIVTADVGPFTAKGLRPAVHSLSKVMVDIATEQRTVYSALGYKGMLVVRRMRPNRNKPGAPVSISNHAWGTAIDLLLNENLDPYDNKKCFYGLTLIAPIFNRHGWFWGGRYRRTEDAMHFEVSKEKLLEWQRSGVFGPVSKIRRETIPPAGLRRVNTTPSTDWRACALRKGDKGRLILLLQTSLKARNYDIAVDGRFGTKTESAVFDFQRSHGLMPNGIVGVKTALCLGIF